MVSKRPQKAYSQNMPWSSSNQYGSAPRLTSQKCSRALVDFFQSPVTLSIAVEASSHPSGLASLFGQPYVYAGGGLGNMDECPLQTCLAGGTSRDSLTFASVCLPEECDALDLAADDIIAVMALAGGVSKTNPLVSEYITLHKRIQETNRFLNTGWTCGEYQVPFHIFPFGGLYLFISTLFFALTLRATFFRANTNKNTHTNTNQTTLTKHNIPQPQHLKERDFQEEKKESLSLEGLKIPNTTKQPNPVHPWYMAWDVRTNLHLLFRRRDSTACLDGIRVGSILWVVLGHTMAIQSSSGGGYSNPIDFLPPDGLTTTFLGQILFSARFAVDTFLLIGGYLVVHVLCHKMPRPDTSTGFSIRYFKTIPFLALNRILRILPLYGMFLGLWTQLAPHMGNGPFWYQWESFLNPCREFGWTNWLFVNNFFPINLSNTDTCFYHSWYLAVDLQLFLVAPLLVYWYQQSPRWGKIVTGTITAASIIATMWLSWTRKWSINTFDGAAVARFDVEGYAKPHIRAQAYFAGMLLGMILKDRQESRARLRQSWKTTLSMVGALLILSIVAFITVTGAYSQRACKYEEWPSIEGCGSTWTPLQTFLYAGTSRAFWSLGISIMLYLCLEGAGGVLNQFLSLPVWTPLSQLSFAVYLVHPIIIFIWQFGDRQKEPFRLLTFGMNYISVCVVSFAFALLFVLTIEFPCANLVKRVLERKGVSRLRTEDHDTLLRHNEKDHNIRLHNYGSLNSNTV